jgi:hypothetical protein
MVPVAAKTSLVLRGKPGHRIYASSTASGLDAIGEAIRESGGDPLLLSSLLEVVPFDLISAGTRMRVISEDENGRAHVRLLSGQRKGRSLWVHVRMIR